MGHFYTTTDKRCESDGKKEREKVKLVQTQLRKKTGRWLNLEHGKFVWRLDKETRLILELGKQKDKI